MHFEEIDKKAVPDNKYYHKTIQIRNEKTSHNYWLLIK